MASALRNQRARARQLLGSWSLRSAEAKLRDADREEAANLFEQGRKHLERALKLLAGDDVSFTVRWRGPGSGSPGNAAHRLSTKRSISPGRQSLFSKTPATTRIACCSATRIWAAGTSWSWTTRRPPASGMGARIRSFSIGCRKPTTRPRCYWPICTTTRCIEVWCVHTSPRATSRAPTRWHHAAHTSLTG